MEDKIRNMRNKKILYIIMTVIVIFLSTIPFILFSSLSSGTFLRASEVINLPNDELIDELNSDLSLINNSLICDELAYRMDGNKSFVGLINKNPNIKKRWFEQYGIIDGGVFIERVDHTSTGVYIKISFPEASRTLSLEFPLGRIKGKLLKSGLVILDNGLAFTNASKIDYYEDEEGGGFDIQGPVVVNLNNLNKSKINKGMGISFSNGGIILFSGRAYTLVNDIKINNEDSFEIDGLFLMEEGGKKYVFNGNTTIKRNYMEVSNSNSFFTSDHTVHWSFKEPIVLTHSSQYFSNSKKYSETMIFYSGNKMKVMLKNNNKLKISDYGIEKLEVLPITDQSKIEFCNGKVFLEISKDSFKYAGDLSNFNLISDGYEIKDGGLIKKGKKRVELITDKNRLIMLKAAEKTKNKEEVNKIKKELEEEYGPGTVKRYYGYINDPSELGIVNSIEKVSKNYGIPPEFLFTVAFGEGLGYYIDNKWYKNPNASLDGFSYLGLDWFGSQAGFLKKGGYLKKDFNEGKEYNIEECKNELGGKVKSATFTKLEYGLEALAATLNYKRDQFLKEASKLGYKKEDFNENELNFWTYAFFNNPSVALHGLKNRRQYFKKAKEKISSTTKSIRYNALVRTATTEFLKKSGVFNIIEVPPTLAEKFEEKNNKF